MCYCMSMHLKGKNKNKSLHTFVSKYIWIVLSAQTCSLLFLSSTTDIRFYWRSCVHGQIFQLGGYLCLQSKYDEVTSISYYIWRLLVWLNRIITIAFKIFKGIVHSKMKICWKFTLPQAIQDVFVSSLEQTLRNVILYHLLINDPLQWMGAVRMRVQTADKKNHNNPQ